jgi:hypothetical protein
MWTWLTSADGRSEINARGFVLRLPHVEQATPPAKRDGRCLAGRLDAGPSRCLARGEWTGRSRTDLAANRFAKNVHCFGFTPSKNERNFHLGKTETGSGLRAACARCMT